MCVNMCESQTDNCQDLCPYACLKQGSSLCTFMADRRIDFGLKYASYFSEDMIPKLWFVFACVISPF